jgi:hypothetical protein
MLSVVLVPMDGGVFPLVVGFSDRRATCACPAQVSNLECAKGLGLDLGSIATCFGDKNLEIANVVLVILYVLTMALLGVLVGLLVVAQTAPKATPSTSPIDAEGA